MSKTEKKSLTQKTLTGSAWVFFGSIVKSIAQLIPIAVLARLISPEEFGLMTGAMIVIVILEQISYGGLGQTIIQRKEINKEQIGTAYICSFAISLTVSILIIIFSKDIGKYLHLPGMTDILPWIAITLPVNSIGIISAKILQRNLDLKFQTAADTASYIFGYYLVGIPLAFLDFGVWSLVIAFLCQVSTRSIAIFIKGIHSFSLKFNLEEAKKLLKSGSAVMLGGIFSETLNNIDKIAISSTLGPASLGLYGRASDLTQRCYRVIDQVVVRVFFPAFSIRQNDFRKLSDAILHAHTLCLVISAPLAVFIATYSIESISIVFGDQFLDAHMAFSILAFSIPLALIARIHISLQHSLGLFWKSTAIQAFILLGGLLIVNFYAKLGIEAVAAAFLSIQTARVVIGSFYISNKLGIRTIEIPFSCAKVIPFIALCFLTSVLSHEIANKLFESFAAIFIFGAIIFAAATLALFLIKPSWLIGSSLRWILERTLKNKSKMLYNLMSR